MERHPDRNMSQRESVPYLDLGLRTRHELLPDLKVGRGNDVSLLTVCIMKESDPCGAIRIVLDRRNLGRYPCLVPAEIDETIHLLVSAATMTARQSPRRVPPTGLPKGTQQPLFRFRPGQIGRVQNALEATARRCRLVGSDRHSSGPPTNFLF